MAPAKRASCQICKATESKYTCAKCNIVYCSVPCYKQHRGAYRDATYTFLRLPALAGQIPSLKWPYVPEESAFPDPLKRDDPKPLQIPQYEAIATSQTVRRVIASNPRLKDILRSIDALRGEERELALQEALGVGGSRNHALASLGHASTEDRDALRQLAEAVEGAVRGGKEGILGLDWGD
ncbi:hypothetical protein L227DRAFT_513667 [Lentinus tigrinus ALCF2SS1-6]|uniref:HIT-type domain-containing protein n=1 Tax=Lentinus tigrinus ALCF2SS1-6 TaxID=1328759 RepID=A0A5C2RRP7_9APHY|nr:hypothetical protein L227DRAFT_513667 [Lentinus tigrinus ALCF2SS1-6]